MLDIMLATYEALLRAPNKLLKLLLKLLCWLGV